MSGDGKAACDIDALQAGLQLRELRKETERAEGPLSLIQATVSNTSCKQPTPKAYTHKLAL